MLSIQEEAIIEVKHLALGNHTLKTRITRIKFEEICYDLFERCLHPLIMCLKEGGKNINDIHEIVLLGGLIKMPGISRVLEE